MAKLSKESAEHVDYGPVQAWRAEADGYDMQFVNFRQEIDSTPLLKGLPGDQCHCAHWGYVLSGRVTFTYPDRVEVIEAGQAFYAPPGHLQMADAGTEYLQFSPIKELREVEATIMRNMQALQHA